MAFNGGFECVGGFLEGKLGRVYAHDDEAPVLVSIVKPNDVGQRVHTIVAAISPKIDEEPRRRSAMTVQRNRTPPSARRGCRLCQIARFRVSHFEFFDVSRIIPDTINRAFSLSSAGTTYQRACLRACRVEAFLIGLHVLLPEFSLGNVPGAEFPVLFRFVDARQEALSLFLLGEVEEELDNAGSVLMKVPLQIRNRAVAVVPDLLLVVQASGNLCCRECRGARGRSTLPRKRIG